MKSLLSLIMLFWLAQFCVAAPRPNILYFYVDDMGWGSIGPNGQAEREVKGLPRVLTPNIDRLAAEGVNFSRAYGCHVCSPARSSQQTGFHQGHTFADRNDPDNAKKAIRTEDITMGDALSAAGYTTGYWGKWGYGAGKEMDNPQILNVQTLPTSHGYQYVLAELHHVRAHTFFQPTLWKAPAAPGAKGGLELVPNSMKAYRGDNYPQTPAMQNDPAYPKTAYCDDTYAFAALDFVRAQGQKYRKSGKPFFGLFAAQIPHAPFGEVSDLPGWMNTYKTDKAFADHPKQAQQWAAMVTRIDAHIGNIVAALDDPNNDGDTSDSVASNTLVLFQSDNGGPGGSNNGVFNSNGGLSGTKGKIQEGGIRVPLVMRWPAKIHAGSSLKAGSDSGRVVDVTDLLPTFCELAGAPVPLGLDGVSIAPLLSGEGRQRPREFVIHEAGNGQSIIRGNMKYVMSAASKPKSKSTPKAMASLFDLDEDPAEQKNIAKQLPKQAAELGDLLIGERTQEPKGFANTYHRWNGKDEGAMSDAANWSVYEYANEGVVYMTDAGAPQGAWTALIDNDSLKPKRVVADASVEFLGLALRGNQVLVLAPGVTVDARNELRIGKGSLVELGGGTLSSLRWIDVQAEGTLRGGGTVDADLYLDGVYEHAAEKALSVTGDAHLSGELKVVGAMGEGAVLSADHVRGKFMNKADQVVTTDGTKYKIVYGEKSVKLVAN